jgi:hypothetical protein
MLLFSLLRFVTFEFLQLTMQLIPSTTALCAWVSDADELPEHSPSLV